MLRFRRLALHKKSASSQKNRTPLPTPTRFVDNSQKSPKRKILNI
jgi:hypothetical protein